MAQIIAHSENGLRTAIHTRSHTVFVDEPLDNGGTDSAPSPTEMLAGSLGACMVITVQLYARRKQWPLEEAAVNVSVERVKKEDYPSYTGDAPLVNVIRTHMTFKGPLTDEQKARLREIGNRCNVHRMLEAPTIFIEDQPALPALGG
jgi:uncharacterized OsmC-like protein